MSCFTCTQTSPAYTGGPTTSGSSGGGTFSGGGIDSLFGGGKLCFKCATFWIIIVVLAFVVLTRSNR